LGIKSRRSYPTSSAQNQQQQGQQQPFAMACLRISDVDTACIALDEQAGPEQMGAPIQAVLDSLKSGQKPSLARIFQFVQDGQQIRSTMAISLLEKEAVIPMALGIPLRMTNTVPVLATIQGTAKIERAESGNGPNAFKVKIEARPMINGVHIQKMVSKLWGDGGRVKGRNSA
jgi:hypothetical protein